MPRNILLLPVLAATLVLAPGFVAAQGPAPAQTRPLDPANRDTTCSACEDFYRWANGGWIKRTPIPGDQPWWSAFHELQDRNYTDLHGLLDEAAAQARTTKDAEHPPARAFLRQLHGFRGGRGRRDPAPRRGARPHRCDHGPGEFAACPGPAPAARRGRRLPLPLQPRRQTQPPDHRRAVPGGTRPAGAGVLPQARLRIGRHPPGVRGARRPHAAARRGRQLGRGERCLGGHAARDGAGERLDDDRAAARSRSGVPSDPGRGAAAAGAGDQLVGLLQGTADRGTGGAQHRATRIRAGGGLAGGARPAGAVAGIPSLAPAGRDGACPQLGVRERELPLQRRRAPGRQGAAPAMEALSHHGRQLAGRDPGAGLRQEILHAGGQDPGARDGAQRPGGVPRPARPAHLDERGDQGQGVPEARRDGEPDRLPGQVARLLRAQGGRRAVRHQPAPGQRVQRGGRPRPDRQADRPDPLGVLAAHGECLVQPVAQRDHLPRRDPAAAVLRPAGRRRRQLRRHGRRHRARDHPRLRRPGAAVRRRRKPERLVGLRPTPGPSPSAPTGWSTRRGSSW